MIVLDITTRLKHFGYEVLADDNPVIEYLIKKVTNYIFNFCNIIELPVLLKGVAVDMVVGEFLQERKLSGQLPNEADIVSSLGAVTSIKEGDITVAFGKDETEARFLALTNYLISGRKDSLIRFRKLVW